MIDLTTRSGKYRIVLRKAEAYDGFVLSILQNNVFIHANAVLELCTELEELREAKNRPHERSEAERAELFPRLERLSDKLMQTQSFILNALHESGLSVIPLPPAKEPAKPSLPLGHEFDNFGDGKDSCGITWCGEPASAHERKPS